MKLKKIAAAVVAAVMSVAMLTACGGGGGGSAAAGTGWTIQEVLVEDDEGEVPEADREVIYQTSDGKWLYERYTDSDGVDEYLGKVDGSESYIVNTESEKWKAFKEDYTGSGSSSKIVNVSTTESVGEYKETKYKTIVITTTYSNGMVAVTTEYYNLTKGTLEYVKTEMTYTSGRGYYEIFKVEINKAEVDRANVDKLNIDNYEKVTNEDDLYDDNNLDD